MLFAGIFPGNVLEMVARMMVLTRFVDRHRPAGLADRRLRRYIADGDGGGESFAVADCVEPWVDAVLLLGGSEASKQEERQFGSLRSFTHSFGASRLASFFW